MKNTIFLTLICAVAIFGFAACEEAAMTPSRTSNQSITHGVSVSIDFSKGKVVEPGRVWTDNGGVQHIQGRVTTGEIFGGDLVGKMVRAVVKDAKIKSGTGNGEALLHVECELSWPSQNLSGTFTGELAQQLSGFNVTSATLDAQGGDKGFAGLHLNLSLDETAPGSEMLKGNGEITEVNGE